MPSRRRDRQRKKGRRPPFREPKPIILIVCEGKKTEPQYFDGFSRACRNSRVKIEIARQHGVPRTLVKSAKQLKNEKQDEADQEGDENLAYDSVWCVFDVDDHPRVADAKVMARDNGIDLAISNPCFELWLLLHFSDSPGMQHRDKVKEMLTGHVPDYDKGVEYKTYATGHPQAVARAKRMDAAAESEGDSGRNPSTGVYKLTELIQAKD